MMSTKRNFLVIVGMVFVLYASVVLAQMGATSFSGPVTINATRPLIFPLEDGTPGSGQVHLAKLGGSAETDIFLSMKDAQPGIDQFAGSRGLILYTRHATAALPVAHASLWLSGRWWDGTASVQRGIELENKIDANGFPQFWMEQIDSAGGHPFLRMFWDQALGGIITPSNQPGSNLKFQARDTNAGGQTYRTFVTLEANSTPSLTIAPPVGGLVTLQGSHLANDGSMGITQTCTTPMTAMVVKNGLITSMTCP